MKALKKATALFLSILMIFGMVSVSATAVLGDGNRSSFAVNSWFLRYDEDTDTWVETDKAARGDKVKVQLNIQTDFGAGSMDLLWEFSKGNLTFDTSMYNLSGNLYDDIHNTAAGSTTGDYGYYGTVNPITKDYETGNTFIDYLVEDGYITEEFTQEYGFLMCVISDFVTTQIVAPKLTSTEWMYEYYFTVADDATGEGVLFLEPSTILGPGDQDLAYFNITRAKTEGVSNITQTQNMDKFQASYELNHGSITFDNTVTFDGNGGTVNGTSEYTGYIGETLSVVDGFAVPTASKAGQKFLGWATTKDATAPDVADVAAIEVDYEEITLYAVYEAAEATYVQNIYTMGTDGAYPETPASDDIGAATGDKVKAADYEVPAGFTLDADKSTAGEVEVTADGTSALNIYLKRNQYSVAFGEDSTDMYYEATYTAPAGPAKEGYTFAGWETTDSEGNKTVLQEGETDTVDIGGVAYTATYTPAANKVTIVINYVDQVTGEAKTATKEVPSTTENTVAIVDEIPAEPAANTDYVLISDLNEIEHYEYTATGSETSVTVAADGKAVINVNYVPKKYTATFGDTATYTEDYHTSITAPEGPEVAGKTFLGWTTDGTTVAVEAGKSFYLTDDVAYTALYTATDYTVTYVYSGTTPAGAAVPEADTANMDAVVTFPTPDAVDGWTFLGWTVDGVAADSVTIATSNVTVTGTWVENTYTVNYWLDSAKTVEYYTENFYFGDAVTIPADPTEDDLIAAGIKGETFTEWEQDTIDSIDATTVGYFTETETGKYVYDLVPITSQIPYTVSITFYEVKEDGSEVKLSDTEITPLYYNNELLLADYEKLEGYTFIEWKHNGSVLADDSIIIEGNTKLYAYFSVNQYPVIFDADGGEWADGDTQKTVMVDYGAMIEAPAELPERAGYTLDAVMPWDPELSEMYPELEWNEELGEWVTAEDYEVPVIYAVWVADEYTVTFDIDGAKTSSTYTYNETKTIGDVSAIAVPEDPTKTGYTFKGWSTDDSADNIVAENNAALKALALPVGDTTYYAIFEANNGIKYTINRYFMETDGVTYTLDAEESETKSDGVAGVEKTITADTYEGFTFDADNAENVLTAEINGDGSTVFKVYYDRDKITVNVNGDVDDYYYGEEIDIPDAPEKEGETFDKWVDEDGNEVSDPYTVPAEEDGEITITPVYTKKTFTATFIIAAENVSNTYTTTEAKYESDVVVPAEPTEANLPTGYTFVGWAKTADATEALDDLGTMPANDVTFYAVLAGKTTISYNIEKYFMETDGVTYTLDAAKSETKTDGTAGVEKTITADSYEGFTFDSDNANNLLTAMIKGDGTTTFKVYYDRNQVKVTIDGEEEYKYYGEEIQTPADVPEEEIPEGNKQDGWVDGNGDPVEFPVKVGTEDIVIEPNFVADEFLITFVNGETTVQSGNQTYGEKLTVPADQVLAGHSFDGWYDANGNKVVAGTTTVPAAATTYTAKFTPVNYTVNFVADGSTVSTGSYAYGTVVSTIAPAYTAPAGYEFKGWSTDGATVLDLSKVTVPVDGATYHAVLVAAEGTAYKIETYVQNTDGTEYTRTVETKYGVTDTKINYVPAEKTGFTLNTDKSNYDDGNITIAGDGSTVIKVFYDRNKVSVTIDGVENEYYFDEEIEHEDPTPEAGYEFSGWKDEDGNTVTFPMNVPAEDIVITPVYTPIKYAVTFNVDGEEYATGTYDYKSTIEKPATDPAKAGYTFLGWSTDGKTVLTDLGTVAIGGNTFQAVFEANTGIEYTVNKVFQSKDGSDWLEPVAETRTGTAGETVTIDAAAEAVSGFAVYQIDPASDTIEGDGSTVFYIYYTRNKVSVTINGDKDDYYYDTEITAPADPTKDGYDFKGWVDEDGNTVTFPITVPAEDMVITPVYEAQTKSLSFEVDGVTVTGYPTTAKVDSAITAPADPKKDGYTFVGWYIKDTNTAFNGKMPTTDTVYEAKWTAGTNTKYTIEIYMMDTDGQYSMQTSTISFGVTGTLAEIVPNDAALVGFTHDAALSELSKLIEADGSTVLKIYYARDLYTVTWDVDGLETEAQVFYGAAIEAPADPAKDGYTFAGWDPEVPATMPANDVEFTATWAEASYTITYVVDGAMTTETHKYGETVTVKAAPSVEGMTFEGWFDGEATKYAAGSTFTMPAKDLIIVADFSVGVYKVTYLDATGAVFTTEMVRFGDDIPVPADAPTKEYYEFKGWNITYDSMPAEDIVVEPIFERIPVKLIPEDGSTTVIDRDNYLIYGLQEYLNENILDKYLDVEGDGYYKIVPVSAGYYGTGAKVELYDNLDTSAPIETYTIIVFGDINGDSLVQAIDSTYADDEQLMRTNWSEEQIFNGTEWVANPNYDPYKTMAADLNGDGIIDSIDATIIGDSSIGIIRINQVTGRTA